MMLSPQRRKLTTPASNLCPAFAVWGANVEVVAEETEREAEIGLVFVEGVEEDCWEAGCVGLPVVLVVIAVSLIVDAVVLDTELGDFVELELNT